MLLKGLAFSHLVLICFNMSTSSHLGACVTHIGDEQSPNATTVALAVVTIEAVPHQTALAIA